MTDRQLYGLFAIRRHEDGTPKLDDPLAVDIPTEESAYRRHLWLIGITGAEQDRLWAEERAIRGRQREREGEPGGTVSDVGPGDVAKAASRFYGLHLRES